MKLRKIKNEEMATFVSPVFRTVQSLHQDVAGEVKSDTKMGLAAERAHRIGKGIGTVLADLTASLPSSKQHSVFPFSSKYVAAAQHLSFSGCNVVTYLGPCAAKTAIQRIPYTSHVQTILRSNIHYNKIEGCHFVKIKLRCTEMQSSP